MEIKNLKKKKAFKDKTKDEQQTELDKLFYNKVFTKEQDKMLYFFLAQPQQTVLIKVGEKQAEKDFIGYEFSSRRGHEGIKMYRDENGKPTTKLYDDDNHLNEEKASSYVYRSFLGEQKNIVKDLQNNITNFDLIELIDFKKLVFEKAISLGIKKKIEIKSKWSSVKLASEYDVDSGTNAPQQKSHFSESSNIHFVRASHLNNTYSDGYLNTSAVDKLTQSAVASLKLKKFPKNTIVFPKSGQSINTNNIAMLPSECYVVNHLACIHQADIVKQKYLFHYLKMFKTSNFCEKSDYPSINLSTVKDHKIPFPPKDVQENIVTSIESLEQDEKLKIEKLAELNECLDSLFLDVSHSTEKLCKLADFKNGLNYSEKSTGESVTIVGVKDFLEDFSPNLSKLIDVRIDGTLSESYKLQSGDILVVRSNGSANLVGRFIYIEDLEKVTSYSGFTIRIRAKSDKINSKYLCYCLRTETVRNKITKDSKGANIKSVNQTMLSAIDVPLPPIEVQIELRQLNMSKEKSLKLNLNYRH